MHNPKSKRYVPWYCAVLIIVCGTLIPDSLQIIHLSIIERSALLFEGFFSIFMLCRHEETRKYLITQSKALFLKNTKCSNITN
jgi:hypothetical protein